MLCDGGTMMLAFSTNDCTRRCAFARKLTLTAVIHSSFKRISGISTDSPCCTIGYGARGRGAAYLTQSQGRAGPHEPIFLALTDRLPA